MPDKLNKSYFGLGKETTPGTGVAPTKFLRIRERAEINSPEEPIVIADISDVGPGDYIFDITTAEFSNSGITVDIDTIGDLLAMLFGAPATTGTAPNYTHVFKYTGEPVAYTMESKTGMGVARSLGSILSSIELSQASEGDVDLQASINGVGMQKAVGGTPASSLVFESKYFARKHLTTLTYGTVNLAPRVENATVTLDFGSEILRGMGTTAASGIAPTGETNLSAELELRFDSVDDASRFADYAAADAKELKFVWALSANTSLEITFPSAHIVSDPWNTSNADLRQPRYALSFGFSRRLSSDLVVVTLKNQTASY